MAATRAALGAAPRPGATTAAEPAPSEPRSRLVLNRARLDLGEGPFPPSQRSKPLVWGFSGLGFGAIWLWSKPFKGIPFWLGLVNSPPMLERDVHWGWGILTHGHISPRKQPGEMNLWGHMMELVMKRIICTLFSDRE